MPVTATKICLLGLPSGACHYHIDLPFTLVVALSPVLALRNPKPCCALYLRKALVVLAYLHQAPDCVCVVLQAPATGTQTALTVVLRIAGNDVW